MTISHWMIGCATALLFGGLSCVRITPTSTQQSPYFEDLSHYHSESPVSQQTTQVAEAVADQPDIPPTHDMKVRLDTVINRIIASRQGIRYLKGYCIQLYSGANRAQANTIRSKVYKMDDRFDPSISYEQPNYKVKVGEYYTRVAANADFALLRTHFSRAALIPKKIRID